MIRIDEKICTGCRTCEFACAFQQKKSFHYDFSLIRIEKKKEEEGFFQVTVCRHCPDYPSEREEAAKFWADYLIGGPEVKAMI